MDEDNTYYKGIKLSIIRDALHEAVEEWLEKHGFKKDRFSEEHPYCKRECDYCLAGKHSQCLDFNKCHDTDEKHHWVDLD